jgi:hypothetical protein
MISSFATHAPGVHARAYRAERRRRLLREDARRSRVCGSPTRRTAHAPQPPLLTSAAGRFTAFLHSLTRKLIPELEDVMHAVETAVINFAV